MGKVKARRFRNCRQDPLAGEGSKRVRGRDEAYQPSAIQPSPLPSSAGPAEKPPAVISKLHGDCSAADKDYACRCVANFVFNHNYLKQLLKHGVVSKLSALFLDDSVSVREVAAGAFRNLTLVVEPSAENKVASDDVLATLPVLIRECHGALNSKGSGSAVSLELWMSVAEQSLHALWNIVELSTAAVESVQREQLVPVLVDFTQHHWTLATPSAQCLYSVLEDNPTLCGMLAVSGDHLQQLTALLTRPKEAVQQEESHDLVVRTAVCGVLHSVLPYLPPSHSQELVSVVCGALGAVLDMDPLSSLHSSAPLAEQGQDQRPLCSSKDTAQECAGVRRRLAAQQLALEVLTNMTCSDDDEWEDMEEEEEVGEDMLMEGEPGDSPSELTHCMLHHRLHEKVWSKCRVTGHRALPVLQSSESLHSLQQYVLAVQSTALMCLQNLVSFLPAPTWAGPMALRQLWESLLQSLQEKDSQRDSSELLEATLGTLRAVLVHLDVQCVTIPQLEFLCVFACTPSLPPSVCASAVQLLGKVARAATPQSEGALQAVARAFSEVLSASSAVWLQAEVLDCVFDVFGESDSSAPVVASSGLLARLCAVQPVFTDKMKQLEGGGRDQAVVEVARTNLPRFIQYIQEQLPQPPVM